MDPSDYHPRIYPVDDEDPSGITSTESIIEVCISKGTIYLPLDTSS